MIDSTPPRQIEGAAAAPPGKRERLVVAASQLAHRQGVARTTLADIAEAADVLVLGLEVVVDVGRRDAHDLAVELVAAYQGSAILTSTLDQPAVMARQA